VPVNPDVNQTVIGVVASDERFTTFLELLAEAQLTDQLAKDGPYTIFAPTNDAFTHHLYGYTLDYLRRPENSETLKRILRYHIIKDTLTSSDIDGNKIYETEDDLTVNIMPQRSRKTVKVNQANIVATDLLASNGVVHAIDSVLIPAR
jgi:uncharacterized surface protein with fasciclin (FAS1) repeats